MCWMWNLSIVHRFPHLDPLDILWVRGIHAFGDYSLPSVTALVGSALVVAET